MFDCSTVRQFDSSTFGMGALVVIAVLVEPGRDHGGNAEFEQMAPVQFRAGTAIVALLAIGPGKLVGLKSRANSVAPPNYDCMRNCHGNTSRACLCVSPSKTKLSLVNARRVPVTEDQIVLRVPSPRTN
jgi:hypothetical protein